MPELPMKRCQSHPVGRCALQLLVILNLLTGYLVASDCSPLSKESQRAILSYAASTWHIGDPSELKLTNEGFFRNTCYLTLVLDGGTLKQPLIIVLSPDHRFISGWLLDLSISPENAEREAQQRTNALLLKDASPKRGTIQDDHVTVVEFGDFQCPYCKRFALWVDALPPDVRTKIALVFKHLPLPQHPWAREAALDAACAGFQSDDAFWEVHDMLFQKQESLDMTTIRDRVTHVLRQNRHFNLKQFESCLDAPKANIVVERDGALARKLKITRTPTLFINGMRMDSIGSADELQRAIAQALRSADRTMSESKAISH